MHLDCWSSAVLSSAVALLGASGALAQEPDQEPSTRGPTRHRVVVEGFSGPRGSELRQDLIDSFQVHNDLELVDPSEVRRVALERNLSRDLGENEYRLIAQSLRVSAFVRGRVSRQRRGWRLVVSVRGSNGEIAGNQSWSGSTVNALGSIRRSGYQRLSTLLTGSDAPEGDGVEVVATADEVSPIRFDDEPAYEILDDEGTDDAAAPRQDWLVFELGIGSLRRALSASMTVQNNGRQPSLPATQQLSETRTYCSSGGAPGEGCSALGFGHMEVGIQAVIYPGAIDEPQPFPYVGGVVAFRHSLFLTTHGISRAGQPIELDTSETEVYLGGRGRYPIAADGIAAEVTGDLGFGLFDFSLDAAGLQQLELRSVVPGFAYTFIHLGVGGSVDAVPTYLTVGADFGLRIGLGLGQDALDVWGATSSQDLGFMVDLKLRSEAPYIVDGAFFGLDFSYFQFSASLSGTDTKCIAPGGMCASTDPWEGYPESFDASDEYLRLGLVLGFAVR